MKSLKIVMLVVLGFAGIIAAYLFFADVSDDAKADLAFERLKTSLSKEQDCQVYEELKQLSLTSKMANLHLAEMHGRGICVMFDLEGAIALMRGASMPDIEIGKTLVQFAIWDAPNTEAGQTTDAREVLVARAKSLGYEATADELREMRTGL